MKTNNKTTAKIWRDTNKENLEQCQEELLLKEKEFEQFRR